MAAKLGDLRFTGLCLAILFASGCDDGQSFSTQQLPLTTYCQVKVGSKTVEMETDYLPHVVQCENGGADFEALKVQAISARGYAYYKMGKTGSLVDGTGDQVYSCGKTPTAEQIRAVHETEGQMVVYRGTTVASFFVAGSKVTGDDCKTQTTSASTQSYVTYNWGKFMDGITQSSIGSINPSIYANRGCNSQNGAHCLAERGWNHRDILRYFYGMDIQIHQVSGPCITTDVCTTRIAAQGETVISEFDGCFSRNVAKSWYQTNAGDGGYLFYTHGCADKVYITGKWKFLFDEPGVYDVYAYIEPNHGGTATKNAPYTIYYSGETVIVGIDQSTSTGWVHLGRYAFSGQGEEYMTLTDLTGDTASKQRVLFDSVKIVRHVTLPENCENGADDDEDGKADCEDSDCAQHVACLPKSEDCANGEDDDGDGDIDCDDLECVLNVACLPKTENCTNGEDDDGDGKIDCDDPKCTKDSACLPASETNCSNGVDDDGDGAKDCADTDCIDDAACKEIAEDCGNGRDDNGDGKADCDDVQCKNSPQCVSHEICNNGKDDDGDGDIDCDDSECVSAALCRPVETNCSNGIDDDDDGVADCLDSDCSAQPDCNAVSENCDNDIDDDGDHFIDCDDPDCDIVCKSQETEPSEPGEQPEVCIGCDDQKEDIPPFSVIYTECSTQPLNSGIKSYGWIFSLLALLIFSRRRRRV